MLFEKYGAVRLIPRRFGESMCSMSPAPPAAGKPVRSRRPGSDVVIRVTQAGCGAGPPQGVPAGATPLLVISYVRTFLIWLGLQGANEKRGGLAVSTGLGHAVAMAW